LDRCADSISTPHLKSVTCIREVGNLVCAILENLAHISDAVNRDLGDCGFGSFGRVLLDQLGHDGSKLCAYSAPVGNAVMLQID
jgi:hypothetical protein